MKKIDNSEKTEQVPLKAIIISRKRKFQEFLKLSSKRRNIRIEAVFLEKDDSEGKRMLLELKIPLLNNIQQIVDKSDIDLIVCDEPQDAHSLWKFARDKGISIITGNASRFLSNIVAENSTLEKKEAALIREFDDRVKKFSIQNELSHIITTTMVMDSLLEKIIKLCIRISTAVAGAIIMYDEVSRKFAVSSSYGLSERFAQRIRLPLSDPVIEDFITIGREMVITDLDEVYSTALFGAAAREGMKSALALPLLTKEKLIGILCIFSDAPREFSSEERELLSTITRQAAIALENAQLYKSSVEKQLLVEQLLSKVIFAQEEERKRIAGEIHDGIAQSMVGILTKVQTSQSLLTMDPKKVSNELEELRKIVTDSVKEVREIIFNLRPSSLDDLGLVASIENLINRIERDAQLSIELIVNERERRLPPIFETIAFRIVQEALTNVRKHSGAEEAWVELYFEPAQLSIKIVDNGRGFDWESVTHKFTDGDSFGIQSMKERASLVGGIVDVVSEVQNGTTVSVILPIERRFTSPSR